MPIADEEKFLVVLVEWTGRTIDSVQVWGPFEDHAVAKKWVEQNAVLHLDPYGERGGNRVFRITRLTSEMFP